MTKFTEQYEVITEAKAPSLEDIFMNQIAAYIKTKKPIKGSTYDKEGNRGPVTIPKGTVGRIMKGTVFEKHGRYICMGGAFWIDNDIVVLGPTEIDLKTDVDIVTQKEVPKGGPSVNAFGHIKY